MERIKDVEREQDALRIAIVRLLVIAQGQPGEVPEEMTLKIIRRASDHLGGTYLIRLFAEFETALRSFWLSSRHTPPPSRTRDLLDGISAARRVRQTEVTNAHLVREYRNTLVHERDEPMAPILLTEARSHLCRFLSFLPPSW